MRPAEKQGWSSLLTETVNLFCHNGLRYQREVKVEGLLVITLDSKDIIIVNVNNTHTGRNDRVFIHKDDYDKTCLVPSSPTRYQGKVVQSQSVTLVPQLPATAMSSGPTKAGPRYVYIPNASVGAGASAKPIILTPAITAKPVANTSVVSTTVSQPSAATSVKTTMRSLLTGLPSTPTMMQANTSTQKSREQPMPILQKIKPHSSGSGDHVTTKKIKVQYVDGIVIVDECPDDFNESNNNSASNNNSPKTSIYSDRLMSSQIANNMPNPAKRLKTNLAGIAPSTPNRMVAKKSTTQRAKLIKRAASAKLPIETPSEGVGKTNCVTNSVNEHRTDSSVQLCPTGSSDTTNIKCKNGELTVKEGSVEPGVSASEDENSASESSDSEYSDPSFTLKSTKRSKLRKSGFKVM